MLKRTFFAPAESSRLVMKYSSLRIKSNVCKHGRVNNEACLELLLSAKCFLFSFRFNLSDFNYWCFKKLCLSFFFLFHDALNEIEIEVGYLLFAFALSSHFSVQLYKNYSLFGCLSLNERRWRIIEKTITHLMCLNVSQSLRCSLP